MKTIEELVKEKERLKQHLEAGKDVLVFSELNSVREKIKKINLEIGQHKESV